MTNPLLDFSGLPRLDAILPEHVVPAMEELIRQGIDTIERVSPLDATPTWSTFVEPLEDANERVSRAWAQVSHLNAVLNTPALRDAYNAALPKVTEYFSEQAQDSRLHAGYMAMGAGPGFDALPAARKRLVENELRDFRLAGAELAPPQKARFLEIQKALARLSSRFQDNLLDATNAFALYLTDPAEVSGIPDDVLAKAAEGAKKDGRDGWKLTLQPPCYTPVLQYADDHGLRERMYKANATRASDLGPPEWDNAPTIARILELRAEAAALLGYPAFADVSLASKMAREPAEVKRFLADLARRAKPFAERDMEELRTFARDELDLAEVRPCDISYVTEKLRQRRYDFSDLEVKQYFPESAALKGLFGLVESLYGLRIRAAEAPTYHPDVRFFEMRDAADVAIGHFYLDLYARENKRGGAWMQEAIARRRRTGHAAQTPVCFLTCNFSAPVGDKPALFTHREVRTLFHEFGHGLHQLLTQVDELGVSGLNGVEWDAVELPSQFMENFIWEWDVVGPMSRHVETGERLPRALFDKMVAAKNFQTGIQFVRQLEIALFDIRLHAADVGALSPLEVLAQVRREVAVYAFPAYDRFPNQFQHIFAGGYAAGYYSYKWAEVLSSDAYGAFEEGGVINPSVGARFRREILAAGGSRPALDSFVAFRGRAPQIDALLRHNGMTV